MANSAPQGQEALRQWLSRLLDLLGGLRQLDLEKRRVLSGYRGMIPHRSPVLLGDRSLVMVFSVCGFIELFFLILSGRNRMMTILVNIVFFAIAYAVSARVRKARTPNKTDDLPVTVFGRTYSAQHLAAALLVTVVLLVAYEMFAFAPVETIVVTAVSIVMGLVVGLIVTFVSVTRAARFNARADRANRESMKANAPIEENALAISRRMNDVAQALRSEYLTVFPGQYLDEEIVGYLLSLVSNYRASTLQEAINLFEEEQHRMRMERSQQQIIAEQQKTQRLQVMSTVINTAMQAATLSEIRTQGQNIAAAVSAPRTVEIRRD